MIFTGDQCEARIISRISPAFLQQVLESFHNFALLRTDGAGASTPSCSKLLRHSLKPGLDSGLSLLDSEL